MFGLDELSSSDEPKSGNISQSITGGYLSNNKLFAPVLCDSLNRGEKTEKLNKNMNEMIIYFRSRTKRKPVESNPRHDAWNTCRRTH